MWDILDRRDGKHLGTVEALGYFTEYAIVMREFVAYNPATGEVIY